MLIEPGKLYRTRDGRRDRIYADDGAVEFPIHGTSEDSATPAPWSEE